MFYLLFETVVRLELGQNVNAHLRWAKTNKVSLIRSLELMITANAVVVDLEEYDHIFD